MNKAKRQAIIAGNWKMNKTPSETTRSYKRNEAEGSRRRLQGRTLCSLC